MTSKREDPGDYTRDEKHARSHDSDESAERTHQGYGDGSCCNDPYYHQRRVWPKDQENYPSISLADVIAKVQGPVYYLALAKLDDYDEADDIVQIVSEKICRYYRENGNVGRHPYAMIKKTTRNAIIDYIRHRAATSAEEAVSIDGDDDDLIALVESLADPDADTEGVAILHLTIEPRVAYVEAHLTDGQRRCLYLYKDVQDGHCTVDEAVAIGGYANRASYYALVSRARKRRDELLKEWEEQGNGTRAVRTLE